jgi:hypothetical protein
MTKLLVSNRSALTLLVSALLTAGCTERSEREHGADTSAGTPAGASPDLPADAPAATRPLPYTPASLEETIWLTVEVEGVAEQREARLWISPQGYAIYVLPQIVMTSEEPNTDQAFARIDGEFFVRVERLDPESNVRGLRNNARLALRDIGRVVELEGEGIVDPLFRDAEFFMHASNPQVSANIIVMDIDGSRYRFFMHIPNREAAEGIMPSFWAMLRSIRTVAPPADDQPAAAS